MRYLIAALLLVAFSAHAQTPRQADISFSAPTQYTDGTPIAAGTVLTYRLFQGAKGAAKPKVAEFTGTSTVVNSGLQPGETCWQVSVVANGAESALSNESCKSFAFPPTEAVTITVI